MSEEIYYDEDVLELLEESDETRKCKNCNVDKNIKEFIKNSKICKFCNNKKLRYKRYNFKIDCIIYKGGKCSKCEYNKCIDALDFHHLNPEEKDFEISKAKTFNLENVKDELDKCILLCANCHREEHSRNEFTFYKGTVKKC